MSSLPQITAVPDAPGGGDDLLALARELGSATLSEAAGGEVALPVALRPLDRDLSFAAWALPVLSPPGDNLWLHRAVRDARPGEALVVDVLTGYEFGYWGEVLTEAARVRGVAGLVINGCVRDASAMRRSRFPVFSTGLCVTGTSKRADGDGSVGAPIRLGAVKVSRGDLVVGDEDGVVVIAADRAAEVVRAGLDRQRRELDYLDRIRGGETTITIYGLEP
jgi:4-hydroxy-4-methyl-2-oxoglutarate aldolase